MRRSLLSVLIVSSSLLVASCDKTPTGQVAAVVDGDEITLQEINGELASMNVPSGVDPEVAQRIALQRVIDRRLLAKTAREEGLDQTPEFFIRQRQLIDNMLIEQYRDKLQRAIAVPSDEEIGRYVSENPEAFADRKLLQVDQITFTSGNPQDLASLSDDHSMDEVERSLQQLGKNYTRSNSELDSALLGKQRLDQIRALPQGEPFILPGPRITTVAVLQREVDAPMSQDSHDAEIVDRLKREQLAELLEARLESAKNSAEIQYQEGFRPDPAEDDES